jgi:colanic acid biosynthesis protein WcaH
VKLDKQDFLIVVRNSPLVAIDLIVKDERGRVLLGLRKNKPAQGYWFVPGGRIYKDERIAQALTRIGQEELGAALDIQSVAFLGVYEHLYEDNVASIPGISTHYIISACQVQRIFKLEDLPAAQHADWRFWEMAELMASESVHPNTKAYFEEKPSTLVFSASINR